MKKKNFIIFSLMVFVITAGVVAQAQQNPNSQPQKTTKKVETLQLAPGNGDTTKKGANPLLHQQSKEISPKEKEAQKYFVAGTTKSQAGDFDGAIQDFTKSLESF